MTDTAELIARQFAQAQEIERLHAIIHGMQDGALIRDQMALIDRLGQRAEAAEARVRELAQEIDCLAREKNALGHEIERRERGLLSQADRDEHLAAIFAETKERCAEGVDEVSDIALTCHGWKEAVKRHLRALNRDPSVD